MPTITRHLRVVALVSDPNLHFCDIDSKPKFVCTYFIHKVCVCVCVGGTVIVTCAIILVLKYYIEQLYPHTITWLAQVHFGDSVQFQL